MRAVKIKGRRGAIGSGIVGYIRLDVLKATKNQPNALNMNFPLQASRSSDFQISQSVKVHMIWSIWSNFLYRLKKVRNSPHDGKIW